MKDADHRLSVDFHCGASGDRRCTGDSQSYNAGNCFFADEVPRLKEHDGRFLTALRDYCHLCASNLKIEDKERRFALGKESLSRLEANDLSTQPCVCEECCYIKLLRLRFHLNTPLGRSPRSQLSG